MHIDRDVFQQKLHINSWVEILSYAACQKFPILLYYGYAILCIGVLYNVC